MNSSTFRQRMEAVKSATTNVAAIYTRDLLRLPILVAPLAEQQRIVASIEEQLSRLDAAVAALERTRQNLKRVWASVLESRIAGGPDSRPLAAILRATGTREEARPALPPGWGWRPLRDLCASITDGDHQPPPKAREGIPFLVIGNVQSGSVSFEGCRHVPRDYYEALHPTRRPRKGDVLYTLVGSFGTPVLLTDDRPFCVQRHIGILRPLDAINPAYLAAALASRIVFAQASAYSTGTAQLTVPLSGLRRMLIPVPPRAEQDQIVLQLDRQRGETRTLDKALASVERRSSLLRSSILSGAFSGNLVPQDPADEPASILLERIAAERTSPNGSKPTRNASQETLPL